MEVFYSELILILFFSYNVDTDEMEMISTGTCPESAIPAVGHTQRATINQNRHEIHVMTVSLFFFYNCAL